MTPEDQQPAERLPIHPTTDDGADAPKPVLPGSPVSPAPRGPQKPIRDLKPGEPPPESSAGS